MMIKLFTLTALLLFLSCSEKRTHKYKYTIKYGEQLTVYHYEIPCDSFQMYSTKHIKFWSDGVANELKTFSPIGIETNY